MPKLEVKVTFGYTYEELITFAKLNDTQLNQIAEVVRKGIEQNILQGREFTGSPVKPLSPATIKRKGSSRPLVDTGELSKGIMKRKAGTDAYEIFVNSNRSKIGYYLHFGTGRMPARPFFGINAKSEKEIEDILFGVFSKKIKK